MPDRSMDALLLLDGERFFLDEAGDYMVNFVVRAVPPSPVRPHGISYSLTLHDRQGNRVMGFDNAHPVVTGSGPGRRRPTILDHLHRGATVKPYAYRDAASLLADFWSEVDSCLNERGVTP